MADKLKKRDTMLCPTHRIVLVANKGGLRCPKCNFVHITKDLRVYNKFKEKRIRVYA